MGKLIIIIEDDPDILDLIGFILSEAGHTVAGYQDIENIEAVINKDPALILLDNRLKDGYGASLCFSIKSNPSTTHIPIVLVSAVNDLDEVATRCKANGYLAKPFDIDTLLEIVDQHAVFKQDS